MLIFQLLKAVQKMIFHSTLRLDKIKSKISDNLEEVKLF